MVLYKKSRGIYRLKLYTNRLTHLLGAGQAGDVQPTTGNCYPAVISTVFVNHIALLLRTLPFVTLRVSFVLRLRQSFPEDCARLKLSSARASQAGLKEMMMQMKNEGVKGVEQQKDPPLLDFSMVGRATNVLVFGRS